MAHLVGRYSLNAQRRGFIICGLVFGTYCLYLIIDGFTAKPKMDFEDHAVISVPKLQEYERNGVDSSDSLIIATLRDFQQARDSLMRRDPRQWQWIVDNRPGLLDSIRQLDTYIRQKHTPLPDRSGNP